ncbi:MAG: PQQ-dependent sugar dehydrogenase, partial [Gemmatimonadales bacterium]
MATPLLLGACGVTPVRPAPPEGNLTATPADTTVPVLVMSTADSASWRVTAVDTVATGLEVPWAIAFAPDGRALVTERPGRIRSIDAQGQLAEAPWGTVPAYALDPNINPETGLMGIVLDTGPDGSEVVYTAVVQRRTEQVGGSGVMGRITRRILYATAPHKASPFVTRVLRWQRGA